MYAYMKKNSGVMSATYPDGIKRVKKGNYAFFMENLMIDYQVQRDCELMQVGGQLDSKGYGVGLPMSQYHFFLFFSIILMLSYHTTPYPGAPGSSVDRTPYCKGTFHTCEQPQQCSFRSEPLPLSQRDSTWITTRKHTNKYE